MPTTKSVNSHHAINSVAADLAFEIEMNQDTDSCLTTWKGPGLFLISTSVEQKAHLRKLSESVLIPNITWSK